MSKEEFPSFDKLLNSNWDYVYSYLLKKTSNKYISMTNQYEVLGKAPEFKDLQKLSGSNLHLQIKNLNAGYGKMEILHNFNLLVDKAQSLCLIGPNGAGKSTILHSIYGFTNIFSGKIEIDGKEITNLTPAEKLKSVGPQFGPQIIYWAPIWAPN